ncbi:MAG: hypothetical protein RO257_14290 [Candidatus Kapabacteria bacterium]|nr:hypothetical protein [Candidatus Kapabacteria bacterium]
MILKSIRMSWLKKFLIFALIVIIESSVLYSQSIGIGDAADFTPDNSSLLELQSTQRGFLMPRMTRNERLAILNPANGLMVVQNDDQPGELSGIYYYYASGPFWVRIPVSTNNMWSLTGNAGINSSINFLGTTDNNNLVFRTNDTARLTILGTGKVDISYGADVYGSLSVLNSNGFGTVFTIDPAQAATISYTLPNAQGAGGTYLKNNGSGILSWDTPSSVAFGDILTGTNSSAVMTVTTGSSILISEDGIIESSKFKGAGSQSDAVDLFTGEVSGVLKIPNGGTGTDILPDAGTVIYSNGSEYSSTAVGTPGQILVSNGSNAPVWQSDFTSDLNDGNIWIGDSTNTAAPHIITGDGTISNTGELAVTGIQGKPVSTTPPTNNQTLLFNLNTNQWEPADYASGGTITSVGLDLPDSVFIVTNSPVTTTGVLTATFREQAPYTVFAGPSVPGNDIPAFRTLTAADIPNLPAAKITSGILPVTVGGTGTDIAPVPYSIIIGNTAGDGYSNTLAAGTTGQVLVGNTGGAPTWSDASLDAWGRTGNSSTNPSANFLGTTDAAGLSIRTSSTERLRILATGNIGIGIDNPSQLLTVKGNALLLPTGAVAAELRFAVPGDTAKYTALRAQTQTESITYNLPASQTALRLGLSGNVLVNTVTGGTGTLSWVNARDVGGSYVNMKLTPINSDYTATENDLLIVISTASKTVFLPKASTWPGKVYYIVLNASISPANITAYSGDQISTTIVSSSISLQNGNGNGAYSGVLLVSDGGNKWYVISSRRTD